MKTIYILIIMAACAVSLFSGCATIASNPRYHSLTIESNPQSANVVVRDKKGRICDSGTTPMTIFINASDGYFSRAAYTIEYSKEGYATRSIPVTFTVSGWFYMNLLSPWGVIGMLIVDPLTGAMYKLNYHTVLTDLKEIDEGTPRIEIMDIDDLTDEQKEHLERIN